MVNKSRVAINLQFDGRDVDAAQLEQIRKDTKEFVQQQINDFEDDNRRERKRKRRHEKKYNRNLIKLCGMSYQDGLKMVSKMDANDNQIWELAETIQITKSKAGIIGFRPSQQSQPQPMGVNQLDPISEIIR